MYREDIPYIKEEIDESEKAKRYRWDIAFGLQAVDGLKPSEYMRELAEEHIEGKIKYQEVERKIKEYYSDNKNNNVDEKEADIVSLRIKKILESKSFILDISMLNSIHKELFTDVLTDVPVGMFRKYNFTKEEDVLYGDTVIYAPEVTISDVLYNYFLREEAAPYGEMNDYDKAMSIVYLIKTNKTNSVFSPAIDVSENMVQFFQVIKSKRIDGGESQTIGSRANYSIKELYGICSFRQGVKDLRQRRCRDEGTDRCQL